MSYNALMIRVYGLFAVQAQATLADVFGVTAPWPVVALVAVAVGRGGNGGSGGGGHGGPSRAGGS